MSAWLCRIARQHRWTFPQPTETDIARWIERGGPIDGGEEVVAEVIRLLGLAVLVLAVNAEYG